MAVHYHHEIMVMHPYVPLLIQTHIDCLDGVHCYKADKPPPAVPANGAKTVPTVIISSSLGIATYYNQQFLHYTYWYYIPYPLSRML
jgi:hypothetical protein